MQGTVWEDEHPAGVQLSEKLDLENGAFSFRAPAGTLDLRFAFEAWAPVYRWRLAVQPTDGNLDLGTLKLSAGASVAGWIREAESDLPIERARVRLAPLVSEWAPKAGALDYETRSDRHGFFQLRGATPGRYRLEATTHRSTTVVLEALEVAADSETMLGALHVEPPLVALVRLNPPVDPYGERWQLHVRPSRPRPEEATIEATAGEDGIAELQGLRPAAYIVEVLTSDGDRLAGEEHEISSDTVLDLTVPVIGIQGVVQLDGEPLEAQIRFQTGASDSAEFESDADGRFEGFLRRPRWPFLLTSVTWRDGGGERRAELEISPEVPEDGDLEVEIEIPNQKVTGLVVDGEGLPVGGARVNASPARPGLAKAARTETDEGGRFEILGLGTQLYRLQAERSGSASEVADVDLGSGSGTREIQLVLSASRVFEGRVVTSQGDGLSGAYLDFETRGRTPVSASTISDWSGAFSLELPLEASSAVLRVFAPSQLIWSECVRLGTNEDLLIRMPPLPGGTLALEARGRPDLPPATGGQLLLVSDRGGIFTMGVLQNWQRRMNGSSQYDPSTGIQTFTVPAMAPGYYALLWSQGQIWELVDAACQGAFSGQPGETLVAGGQAHLSFDVSAHQERADATADR